MKKAFVLMLFALLFVSAISAVSAKTIVAGKIYDSPNFETANGVADANINITCNGNLITTQSLLDGTYSEGFDTNNCPNNSTVIVIAEKDGITNSDDGVVHDYTVVIPDLYIGVVNIALIPEFGLIAGALAIIGSIGLFFIVRRK